MDIRVRRNHYGAQTQSFEAVLSLNGNKVSGTGSSPMLFIRAPRILNIDERKVKILAKYGQEAVAVRQNNLMGTTFHPELTDDLTWHLYFMKMIISFK
jgi:5'-phosphate synthase pdxT subunit